MGDKILIKGVTIDNSIALMLTTELQSIIGLIEQFEDGKTKKLLIGLHRLKGSTGFIGLSELENLTREVELEIKTTSTISVKTKEHFLSELKNLLKDINDEIS